MYLQVRHGGMGSPFTVCCRQGTSFGFCQELLCDSVIYCFSCVYAYAFWLIIAMNFELELERIGLGILCSVFVSLSIPLLNPYLCTYTYTVFSRPVQSVHAIPKGQCT